MKKLNRFLLIIFLGIGFFPVTGIMAEDKPEIQVHGYISQGFLISDHNNFLADTVQGTFQFNELGIHFSTEVNEKLRIGIQLAARDLGGQGNDKIVIDWAYADYRWQDWLGIRLGKIKIPLGFYNKTIDLDMLRTFVLLPQGVYSETFRDTLIALKGVGIYGDAPLKVFGDLSYEVLYGTMNIESESTTARGVETPGNINVEEIEVKQAFSMGLTWETPLEGLRLGISRVEIDFEFKGNLGKDLIVPVPYPPYQLVIAPAGTPFTSSVNDFCKSVYSLEYTWKELIIAVEYFQQDFSMLNRITGVNPMTRALKFDGYYGSACYRFSDWLEVGVYHSVFYKNRNDRQGTKTPYNPPFSAYQKDTCLSFRFDLNDNWTFKIEGHALKGTALCIFQDNLNDEGVLDYHKHWVMLAAKMTFSF